MFAPVNAAFAERPSGTVNTPLKPENKDKLTGVLTYHVVAGRITARKLKNRIEKGHGKAVLKTVAGGTLTATLNGPNNVVSCTSNGVIHAIDQALLPKT